MNVNQILIVISALVVVLLLWIIVGLRNLRSLRRGIKAQWEEIDLAVSRRQDMIPLLIEIVRKHQKTQEKLLEDAIKLRAVAVKVSEAGAKKIEVENDLSKAINKLIDLGHLYPELAQDVRFLELRKDLKEQGEFIDEKVKKYNGMVRYFNSHRDGILMKPLAVLGGFKRVNIFDFE